MTHRGGSNRRSRVCRRWLQDLGWLVLAAAAACDEHDASDELHSAVVGRFEPRQLPDAGEHFASQPCTRAEIPDEDAGTHVPGQLQIAFTTTIPPGVVGDWDKQEGGNVNAGVIWIEDEQGALVKTLAFWGHSPFSLRCLPDYVLRNFGGCTIDVITGPTLWTYTPNMFSWDGTSFRGAVVPDGNYTLLIDIQIDEHHTMAIDTVPFTKGRKPFVLTPAPMPPQTGLTVTYTPN